MYCCTVPLHTIQHTHIWWFFLRLQDSNSPFGKGITESPKPQFLNNKLLNNKLITYSLILNQSTVLYYHTEIMLRNLYIIKLILEISSVCRKFTLGRHKVATCMSCPSLVLDQRSFHNIGRGTESLTLAISLTLSSKFDHFTTQPQS